MKFFSLMLLSFLFVACMETPDPSSSKENVAKETIHDNKAEAKEAQEAYRKLQKRRNNE